MVMSCSATQLIFLEYHQLQEVLEVRLLIIITSLHYLLGTNVFRFMLIIFLNGQAPSKHIKTCTIGLSL